MLRNLPAFFCLAALAIAGCGTVTEEKPFTVAPDTPYVFETTPQTKEQEVRVVVISDSQVNVCLLPDTPADVALKEPFSSLKLKAAVTMHNATDMTKTPLVQKVPAGKRLTVWIGANGTSKTATGKLKLTY